MDNNDFKHRYLTPVSKLFRNDKFILSVITLNAIAITLQVSGCTMGWIAVVDFLCTIIFLLEMIAKQHHYGIRRYWSNGWNRFDGTLVILSLPSLLAPFINTDITIAGMSVSIASSSSNIILFRLLRVLRFFRLLRFFPNFTQIMKGFRLAMKQTWGVLTSFALVIFIFSLINCSLFGSIVPQYFGTPLMSIYSVFRIFTVEGWYEIPDAIAAATSSAVAHFVRLYFSILLLAGGIIGMSFINSVFVDAMAEDNNDDVKEQLDRIEKQLKQMQEK